VLCVGPFVRIRREAGREREREKAALNHRVAVFEMERMRIYFVTASHLEWKERTDLERVSACCDLHFVRL